MKITQRKQLETAYLQPDLLPADSFVSYCRDNGFDTDLEELEYFDKQSLFIPTLRVRVGVVKYKRIFADFDGNKEWRHVYEDDLDKFAYEKIDPKTYYDRGALIRSMPGIAGKVRGFHYGDEGWLDWYSERDMVTHPATDGYIPWKKFEGGQSFSLDPKPFEEVGYLLYAKHQMYPLKEVQKQRQLVVKNQGLFRTSEQWAKEGAKITDIFTKGYTDETIRKRVAEYNRFFSLLNDIRILRSEKNNLLRDTYQHAKKSFDDKTAAETAQDEVSFFDGDVRGTATDLMKRHGFTIEDLTGWRFTLLTHGSFDITGDSKRRRAYVARLDDYLLNDTEDVYNLVNIMSWFVDVLGGDSITAKQLLLREMTAHCVICGKGFEPKRRTQVTCANPACKKAQQLKTKREMRRIGKYAG